MYTKQFTKFNKFIIIVVLISQTKTNATKSQKDSNYNNFPIPLRRNIRQSTSYADRCKIPNNLVNTTYTILGESGSSSTSGDYVSKLSILQVSCSKGYAIMPFAFNHSFCINGVWEPLPTICLRLCPTLTSTTSTEIKCKYNDVPLDNCINPVHDTKAFVFCKPLYEEPGLLRNRIRVCRNGRWDSSIPDCHPICGVKRPIGLPSIVNGVRVLKGDYPWQVGLYSDQQELLCGGSIIDTNIILTAAHCVTDYEGHIDPSKNYLVAAGKYFSKYDDRNDIYAQYSQVGEIHVPERYKGYINFYDSDIAILILKDPFTVSEVVQPICIEGSGESPNLRLTLNSHCVITGWGFTEEGRHLSEMLQELTVPYIPYQKCFDDVPPNYRKFITHDKVCAGYLNNKTSTCGGDSGGGLMFLDTFRDRYFIKGVLSTSPASRDLNVCDSNQYSVYTSVFSHNEFIANLMAHNHM